MQLLRIIPNAVGRISDQEAQSLLATRELTVRAFMLNHMNLSEADQFLETIDLLNQTESLFEGLVSLSIVAVDFAKYCMENSSGESVAIAEEILKTFSVFTGFNSSPLDTDEFVEEFVQLPHTDLRHGKTSILYQTSLNLSNLYTLLVRLCNKLSDEVMGQFDGAAKDLAKTVYEMTEKVRYERSK